MYVRLEDRISFALGRIFAGESLYETVVMDDCRRVYIFLKDWQKLPAEVKTNRLFYLQIIHCFRKIFAGGFEEEIVLGPGNYRFCVSLSCLSRED